MCTPLIMCVNLACKSATTFLLENSGLNTVSYLALYMSCLGSSVGRALCLEYRVSWVRVPPEAAHFF